MDWLDEKIEQIKKRIQDLSLKWALAAYLLLALFAAFLFTWIIQQFCILCCNEVLRPYGVDLYQERIMGNLYYTGAKSVWYNLTEGEQIKVRICLTFEQMRKEIVSDREELWRQIGEQKEVNAAFAHDMRTPLTVLRGYAELLYRYTPEGKINEEKLTSTLKLMSRHLRRLEDYTKTMRQIRSFEEIEPRKAQISVRSLWKRIDGIAGSLNAVGDIQIVQEQEGALPNESLWLDESLFLEVLENLLSNALRYAGSKVELSLEYERETGMLFLFVHDDGSGFDEESLRSAAEPYFRGEEKDPGEHFGIGLHVCRMIAGKHGGELSLANSMDGGAFASVSFFCRKS
ncbi:sensor histidine kinase [Clostridium sp. Marseille-P3244]|uniref:sensor histidine kinase n=1 Tax=Clostridium sp. Marseille-P3244 TaxID=1871020 RepID=UPI0009305F40|nr:HAMP domain-containing sensor histidine kinase [Clostridium sp. Marseille-P3244]